MLVLSRQRDEILVIGDDIEVVVVDIRGDRVRLGVNAPKEVSVHRKEVRDMILREGRILPHLLPNNTKKVILKENAAKTDISIGNVPVGSISHEDASLDTLLKVLTMAGLVVDID